MKLQALKCLKCGDIIYSRALHDWHSCFCGNVFVDGGRDYFRYGVKHPSKFELIQVDIAVTREELYQDWNLGYDKYGILREAKDE